MTLNVIGAGLAGCEAAWQAARLGIKVNLYEMKPNKKSPAHKSNGFAELVCSNSFKAARLASAAGMLKQEMRLLGSLLIDCADKCSVPAGGALAVDREIFSSLVTEQIKSNKNITVIEREITQLDFDGVTVVATGPLTSESLSDYISEMFGGSLSFFDAAAPIVTSESIDMTSAFTASRYERGGEDDYINCPLSRDEFELFENELINAQRAPLHDFDVSDPKVYEGCMPIEIMAQRGKDAIRFGPMKPVGLTDPKTGKRPWAVLQLRRENSQGSMYNLVGFQTNLKFSEQKRVFSLIPALKNAEFVRFGVMHRNTFIDSPRLLNPDFSTKNNGMLFFAGQITGVEGYMESASSGLIAGINAALKIKGNLPLVLPKETMIGSLSLYISDSSVKRFQPMGANLGILPALDEHIRDKKQRAAKYAERSVNALKDYIRDKGIFSQEA